MDWLNFGNFQDNGGQPTEDELYKQLNTPEVHQSLADYMNATYGQQGNGMMPTGLPSNHDDTLKYSDLFKAMGGAYDPNSGAWYNQGQYSHKQGSSLTSLIGMMMG